LPSQIVRLDRLALAVFEAYAGAGRRLATAESCTGGMVAVALTAIPGASTVFERGFVTYSNAAKAELLGVDPVLIERVGAVSQEVAAAMADGARARSRGHVAIAVTGIAGPDGGSPDKPVGLVWFGLATGAGTLTDREVFAGDRTEIRLQATERALRLLLQGLNRAG
jgi:nicotinamide-nucleotide amidase